MTQSEYLMVITGGSRVVNVHDAITIYEASGDLHLAAA